MTTKHTFGPWKHTRRLTDEWKISGEKGEWIASVWATMEDGKTFEANAALIAAAPELLAALEHIVSEATDTTMDNDAILGYIAMYARAAITKAKGEQ